MVRMRRFTSTYKAFKHSPEPSIMALDLVEGDKFWVTGDHVYISNDCE